MAKNPLYLDKVVLKNGGTIERADGTAIVAVNAAGSTTTITGTESIVTSEIADLAVTTAKINDLAVTTGKINTAAVTNAKIASGAIDEPLVADTNGTGILYVKKSALAVYDFAVDGGVVGDVVLAATSVLPDNAVVTAITYDVLTTCTSAGDAATIAFSLPVDGAFTTAIDIQDASNPWDAGVHLASVVTPIAKKTTAARQIGITIGVEAITAGKIVFGCDYYVSQ